MGKTPPTLYVVALAAAAINGHGPPGRIAGVAAWHLEVANHKGMLSGQSSLYGVAAVGWRTILHIGRCAGVVSVQGRGDRGPLMCQAREVHGAHDNRLQMALGPMSSEGLVKSDANRNLASYEIQQV